MTSLNALKHGRNVIVAGYTRSEDLDKFAWNPSALTLKMESSQGAGHCRYMIWIALFTETVVSSIKH